MIHDGLLASGATEGTVFTFEVHTGITVGTLVRNTRMIPYPRVIPIASILERTLLCSTYSLEAGSCLVTPHQPVCTPAHATKDIIWKNLERSQTYSGGYENLSAPWGD